MARKKRSSTRKKGSRRQIVVVSKTHHRRRRRVSGAVGATKHRKTRKKRGIMGGTSSKSSLKEIAMMAAGVAGGALGTHYLLRPIEAKIAEKYPAAAKGFAIAEVLLGGYVALKSKHPIMKAVGIGVLAGGTHGVLMQFKMAKNIPGIAGPGDDMTTVRIPVNGPIELSSMVAGILDNNETPNMPQVMGQNNSSSYQQGRSNRHANRLNILKSFVGESDDLDFVMPAKGANF